MERKEIILDRIKGCLAAVALSDALQNLKPSKGIKFYQAFKANPYYKPNPIPEQYKRFYEGKNTTDKKVFVGFNGSPTMPPSDGFRALIACMYELMRWREDLQKTGIYTDPVEYINLAVDQSAWIKKSSGNYFLMPEWITSIAVGLLGNMIFDFSEDINRDVRAVSTNLFDNIRVFDDEECNAECIRNHKTQYGLFAVMLRNLIMHEGYVDAPLFYTMYGNSAMMGSKRKRLRKGDESNPVIDLNNTKKSPILFLRSFGVTTGETGTSSGVDEFLFGKFDMMNSPVLSLANPDYCLEGGSLKFQATDDEWQKVIEYLYPCCGLVVMVEGKSEGLKWEIQRIKRFVSYGKLLIITLPEKYRYKCWYEYSGLSIKSSSNKRQAKDNYRYLWRNFAKQFREQGIMLPEEDYGSGRIISFTENWEVDSVVEYDSNYQFKDYVLNKYDKHTNRDFDYSRLFEFLKPYEVSDAVPEEIVQQYTRFTKSMKRILKLLFWISLALIVVCYW